MKHYFFDVWWDTLRMCLHIIWGERVRFQCGVQGVCINILRVPQQSTTDWVAQNNRNWFPVLEVRNLKSRCQQGWFLLRICFMLLSSFWWLLSTLGLSWLVDTSFQYLPLSSHGLPFCFLSLIRTMSLDLGPTLIQENCMPRSWT